MGESLTMRRCVKDEGLRIVNFCHKGKSESCEQRDEKMVP